MDVVRILHVCCLTELFLELELSNFKEVMDTLTDNLVYGDAQSLKICFMKNITVSLVKVDLAQ